LKSPAFKKEMENLNKAKQSEIEKISSILKLMNNNLNKII